MNNIHHALETDFFSVFCLGIDYLHGINLLENLQPQQE